MKRRQKRNSQVSDVLPEHALGSLLYKLKGWLEQQPEWVIVLGADRKTRKVFEAEVAKFVTRIPTVDHAKPVLVDIGKTNFSGEGIVVPVPMNRAERRRLGVKLDG